MGRGAKLKKRKKIEFSNMVFSSGFSALWGEHGSAGLNLIIKSASFGDVDVENDDLKF